MIYFAQDTKEGKDKDRSKLADLTVKEDEVQDILKENKSPPHIKGEIVIKYQPDLSSEVFITVP